MTRQQLKREPAFIIIIRAIHEDGFEQDKAMDELTRRGLWLTADQLEQARRIRQ